MMSPMRKAQPIPRNAACVAFHGRSKRRMLTMPVPCGQKSRGRSRADFPKPEELDGPWSPRTRRMSANGLHVRAFAKKHNKL